MKYRAIQVALVIHFAEELRQTVITSVQATDQMRSIGDKAYQARAPAGQGNTLKNALGAWVDEGLISKDEASEIVSLIDYRNDVAHRIHELNVDISASRNDRWRVKHFPEQIKRHDYEAVDRLKAMIERLHARAMAKHWAMMARLEGMSFETAERALTVELKSLEKKIQRLAAARRKQDDVTRQELKSIRTKFAARFEPRNWPLRYQNGRLTEAGAQLCDDLFSEGYSTLAVAYALELSLVAARKRRRNFKNSPKSNQERGLEPWPNQIVS